jgi:L-serine dehydratase
VRLGIVAPDARSGDHLPALLRYYRDFCTPCDRQGVANYFLAATAFGGIIKRNASISGAEMGCQGEVGSAAAMAAAGLAAALGGSNEQIENAAEIALEHHLGMTCDPIGGLVQIPCVERNAFGAIKAINAASMALHGDGTHRVPLDQAIETLRQTGTDMQSKDRETSRGGLAVNVPEC